MKALLRWAVPVAVAVALSGCSIGSLLGGGGKGPTTLLRLTPQAALQGSAVSSASAGEAVTIALPIIGKELRTVRVPAQVDATQVAYIEDLEWVDTPDRLFQDLLAETVRRTSGRVVLDPRQTGLDPGITVSGQLHRFGYDAAEQAVIVRFDGVLSTTGGSRVETRRFEARVPAAGDAASVGPALNQAANQVAIEAAGWIAR
jgi:cholesterol transport system auxiliary component